MKFRLLPAAERDVREAYRWYRWKSSHAGQAFRNEVEVCLGRISENPGGFPQVHGVIRRALLRRYPYCVFFIISEDDIVILAVLHARRDPAHAPGRRGLT